jgi:hypothetical protein
MKCCTKCGVRKPETEFPVRRDRKCGRAPGCKQCKAAAEALRRTTPRYEVLNTSTHRKEKRCERNRLRRLENPSYRIRQNLAARVREALKDLWKGGNTVQLLGCSTEQLKSHLESKFSPGMSWENYGRFGWHIDHVVPCSRFDFTEVMEQKKCFNYKNLQPLWWRENLMKGAKI